MPCGALFCVVSGFNFGRVVSLPIPLKPRRRKIRQKIDFKGIFAEKYEDTAINRNIALDMRLKCLEY